MNEITYSGTGLATSTENMHMVTEAQVQASWVQVIIIFIAMLAFSYSMMYIVAWYVDKKRMIGPVKWFKFVTLGLGDANDVSFNQAITITLSLLVFSILTVIGYTPYLVSLFFEKVMTLGGILC